MSPSAQIFKVNQLGDSVVFLPVVQRLVSERRFSELTVWTTPSAANLYRGLPVHLEVVAREEFYPAWKNPLGLLALARRARRTKAPFALVTEDMGNTAYFLALASGAKNRVGTIPPFLKIPGAVNHAIDLDPSAPEAEKSWTLGRALAAAAGGKSWPERPPPPDLSALAAEPAPAFDVIVHAGASCAYKRWPLERAQTLAKRLSRNLRVGWCVVPEAPAPEDCRVVAIPSGRLEDLVSLIARASLLIGNNSGPMNIASALGVPALIFSGPSARSWDPYWHREKIRLLRHDALPCIACDPPGLRGGDVCTNLASPMACMNFWTVDRVEAEARAWLEQWPLSRQ